MIALNLLQIISNQEVWKTCDPNITKLILEQIWTARESSTIQNYCYSLRRFFGFLFIKELEIKLPFSSFLVAQYITYLRFANGTKGAINLAISSIKWVHTFVPGIKKNNDPLDDLFLSRIINSAQRGLSKAITRKKPLSGELLKDIIANSNLESLTGLRNCLIPALAYSLLLRHDELSHINCAHISI